MLKFPKIIQELEGYMPKEENQEGTIHFKRAKLSISRNRGKEYPQILSRRT